MILASPDFPSPWFAMFCGLNLVFFSLSKFCANSWNPHCLQVRFAFSFKDLYCSIFLIVEATKYPLCHVCFFDSSLLSAYTLWYKYSNYNSSNLNLLLAWKIFVRIERKYHLHSAFLIDVPRRNAELRRAIFRTPLYICGTQNSFWRWMDELDPCPSLLFVGTWLCTSYAYLIVFSFC